MWLLSGVAVLLGLVGGGAAVGLFKLIGLLTHLTLLHDIGSDLPSLRHYDPSLWIIASAVGGALVVALLAMWAPVIRGHGIPESLEAILFRDSRIKPRAAIAKPLSAAITIGTGGPFGAEGPIIVTGGSIGSLIGQVLSVSPVERRIMLATGAAAGMSATFNAPIASVILATELVLFERSLRTIVPLSVGCGVAASIHVLAFGSGPLFTMPAHLHVVASQLPVFAVVGVMAGLLAVLLNKGLFAVEAVFRSLPVNIFWWPTIGALGFSLIGLLVPRTLSMGYSAITDTLNGRFTVTALAALLVSKLVSWWISLGSQTSGGTLAPMFLVGAAAGGLLGQGIDQLFPAWHVSPEACALVAMGAAFGAATKAVFTSVVFAMEVTAEFQMAVPLLIGVAVAELVAELFLTDRLMTKKLTQRGFRVDFRTEVDALRMRVAHQVMSEPISLSGTATVAEARRMMTAQGLDSVAVIGPESEYLGLVRGADLQEVGLSDERTLVSLVKGEPVFIASRDFLHAALHRFNLYGVNALPVVREGRVVGHLGRADIATHRHRHHTSLETRQPGWLASRRIAPTRRSRHAPARGHANAVAVELSRLTETPQQTLRRLNAPTESQGAPERTHADGT